MSTSELPDCPDSKVRYLAGWQENKGKSELMITSAVARGPYILRIEGISLLSLARPMWLSCAGRGWEGMQQHFESTAQQTFLPNRIRNLLLKSAWSLMLPPWPLSLLGPELDFQAKAADRIIPPDLSPQTAKTMNMGGGRLEERKYPMLECKASCFPSTQRSPEGEQGTMKRAALFKHFCFGLLLQIEIKRERKPPLKVECSTSFYAFVLWGLF